MSAPPCGPEPAAVTDDAFLGGQLSILQPRHGYRAGVDAVLLAASVVVAEGCEARVLDLGAGVGTAGLAVARRCALVRVDLLEREPELARLAAQNAARNGLTGRVRVVEGDLAAPALALPAEAYEHVIANPPFHTEGKGTGAATPLKAAAHAMPAGDLDLWARAMARHCTPGGRAAVIHRAEALPEILTAFARRFGDVTVLPIHPRAGEPAIRVLVRGKKGSRAPLRLLPGFVLHEADDHAFTPAARAILREGAAL
jgi:tRNA1(Val) A37 N6-methylase TrmN6